MQTPTKITIFATLCLLPLIAHAHEHTVLVQHIKNDFFGYAVAVSLMLWAVCELRKDDSEAVNSTSAADSACASALQTVRHVISKAVGRR